MPSRRHALTAALALPTTAMWQSAAAQSNAPASAPAAATPRGALFAVEFRLGAKWDASKKPHEQAYFREHSANLKRLRDDGRLVMGARYADKGFVLLAAVSQAEAQGWIEADPAVQNQMFAYDIHPFQVFYAGCVELPKRPSSAG